MEIVATGLENYLRSVIADPGRPGLTASGLRGFLGGLAALYDLGLEGYLTAERFGLRRREKLPVPLISIGNLTVGGTGKTPMTQLLCRRLHSGGIRTAILSRGHGGDSQAVRLVSSGDGRCLRSAAEAGDEPVLLARTLPGTPVLVGKDRRQSGREALRRFDLDALILDDGFQFWQLARDLDIVLLDARKPFDNGFLLPRGLLREPKRHLRRAGIVVMTRAGRLNVEERRILAEQCATLAPGAVLHFADHRATGFVSASDLSAPLQPLSLLSGHSVYAVSAIAQPSSFMTLLEEQTGVSIAGQQAWGDHHAFDAAQASAVQQAAREVGAAAIVMTEKDAVKWPVSDRGGLPTYALRIEMVVEHEEGFLANVRAALGRDRVQE